MRNRAKTFSYRDISVGKISKTNLSKENVFWLDTIRPDRDAGISLVIILDRDTQTFNFNVRRIVMYYLKLEVCDSECLKI